MEKAMEEQTSEISKLPTLKQTVNKNYNFLDLDCVIDTEKTIQLWIGYMTKQLLDNNINIIDAPEYIERTLTGSVKKAFVGGADN